MAERNLILKFLAGSHVYGTNTEKSDKDYLGVFIPDPEYVLGTKTCEQVQIRTNPSDSKKRNTEKDVDTVLYSLPKFIHLAAGNNPTIIETLFYDEKHTLYCNDFGRKLLDNAKLFSSKRIKDTFLGYALSQKSKLLFKRERLEEFRRSKETIDKWEKEGHVALPERLKVKSILNEKGSWKEYEKGMKLDEIKKAVQEELDQYGHRTSSIDTHGYDLKFASHLIRLLDEGIQYLVEGKLSFPPPSVKLIRDIKLGKYSLDDVMEMCKRKEALIEESYVRSSLQTDPDYKAIDRLQIQLLQEFWAERKLFPVK